MPLSLPNALTLARVAAVPALVAAFYLPAPASHWASLAIFVLAGITDWLDGFLARRWNQGSDFGRVLDPIADKLLVAAALVMLAAFARLSLAGLVAAILILGRELLVSGLREFLAGRLSLPVTALAKWKTATQMVALGTLLIAPALASWGAWVQWLGEGLLVLAALLTVATGWGYVAAALAELKRGDAR